MSIQAVGIIPEWTIGDRLRKAREAAGLDQAELGSRIDVSRRTIGNYETGRVEPRLIVLKQWALATGVRLEWITTGTAPTGSPDGGATGEGVTIYYPFANRLNNALVAVA